MGPGSAWRVSKDYYDSIGANKPVVYMTYMRLDATNLAERFAKLKAFCYINQDWDSIGKWKGWGDSRLSQNQRILQKFQNKIGTAMFLHGADREQTLKAMHAKE